jgi:hypothetical protein
VNVVEILLVGLLLVLGSYGGYRWRVSPARQQRRRQLQGIQNAKQLQAHLAERCVICHLPVDPAVDIYDEQHRDWWHRQCWQKTITLED